MSFPFYSDEYFMKEALKQASISYDRNEIPIGSVVVYKNRIIAKAYNQIEQLNDSTAHAEMIALTSAFNFTGSKYLTECTVYVTLEPCVMCAGAMFWAQIGRLVYGASDPKRGFNHITKKILHPKTKITTDILLPECKQILEKFFYNIRNKN